MYRGVAVMFAVALGVLSAAPEAAAQQRERRERPKPEAETPRAFTTAERELMAQFFAEHEYDARPLPPGIARNLARGRPLPPGIAKRSLPEALVQQLPEREGLEVTVFGDRIVLLEAGGLVVDILEGIFR